MGLLENIQHLCEEIGTSVPKLEQELGFGKGSIYKWAKSSPTLDKLEKVANYLKVSLDYLLDRGSIFDLGPYIEEERHEQGLSAEEFSSLLGISPSELDRYENQEIPLTDKLEDKIMSIFGMTSAEFRDKYGLFDEKIPDEFDGDINSYISYEKIKEKEASQDFGPTLETIAAHHDEDEWTEEDLEDIEQFKEFIRMRREKRNKE
ncbi:helix-turn-helix domain-containing protein [Paenibacillus azoreducens]|uniref:HTH cro/C1-type domain-containing protein n=1 Tax=Paenibacillus azoreducens TaxID=116718 RepID=A0A919YEK0_9BACL|nr:helix-turn-helix transcriptional regulator [Paenibacillus azoreducens]GIO50226.1 hypothetical protein J34TS1_49910 [Paenibacillus azoreducens]